MLFHQIASLIFSVIKIIFLLNVTPKVKSFDLFSTNPQNITFANKIIEKLLKNYEILKNIYKSQDILHSSSSFEANNTYMNPKEKETSRHGIRSLKKAFGNIQTTFLPQTAIIYGSASSHEDTSNSVEKTKRKPIKIDKNKNLKQVKFENILENNNKEESVEYESKESESNDDIQEISLEITSTIRPKKKLMNTKKTIKKKKPKHNDLGEKTRFDVLKKIKHKKRINHKAKPRTEDEPNARRIKKVVYSELFSPFNIWYEVVNKPIKLNIDTDPFIEKPPDNLKDAQEKVNVFVFKANTKESLEEETEGELKKMKIDNIIRSTYGEACLKTPIKKCKKAVKAVKTNVCRSRFKCKSEFKSDFVSLGNEECEKEFSFIRPQNNTTKKPNEDKIQPLLRKRDDTKTDENVNNKDISNEEATRNNDEVMFGKTALRDKYERACQKQSRSKCIRACKNTVERTCSRHTCQKGKSRALQKSCKTTCKNMFVVQKDSDESDATDSDSDSDSD